MKPILVEAECPGPDLSVVVPLHDERENLAELHRRLASSLAGIGRSYELVFIDDGSRDGTSAMLDDLHAKDPNVGVVHLSRNFGHQAAVSAGIELASGRAVIVMDGDLQDPPEVLGALVARWVEGNDVVFAVRRRRKEGPLKRTGYHVFYRLLNAISDLDIPLDSGDFCLMDRRVVDVLVGLPERARFVRGLRTFVGFRQVGLDYDRASRDAGASKYTLRRLVGLAVDGLLSFSSYPLRMATRIGLLAALMSLALLVWVVADAVGHQTAPRGWASTLVVVLVLGSVQLICLGIVGEYIRLIFTETKRRPTYIASAILPPRGPDGGSATGEGR